MSHNLSLRQHSLPGLCPITAAVDELACAGGSDERGAVFTRREVVEFILDLVGYTSNRPLQKMALLEPSFGRGDFLLPAIERLLGAWLADDRRSSPSSLGGCIRGVELHRDSFHATRNAVLALLIATGITRQEAIALADCWLLQDDFLLTTLPESFHVVVGNPPYVRQEMIPDVLLAEYRSRYTSIYDRADLYIPFIERSLRLLNQDGVLGFICADRWMKNRYGGPLRSLVAERFHLKIHVDMTDTPAFHTDVVAYPAITIITRERAKITRTASRPPVERDALIALAAELTAEKTTGERIRELTGVAVGAEPWLLESSAQTAMIRRLERDFPALEDAGCKVGIGVATGADQAFIGPLDALDVEDDRKLPLATTRDISGGTVQWHGLGVINPFSDQGDLVDLASYPRLRRYLEDRKEQIAARHCAKRDLQKWYRTIDRIVPALAKRPKLLIPDIKGNSHVVFEEGSLYPHHNLYFITSDDWNLHALQAVLLSNIARLFIATYSTRMRGGFLRFQAQYLRRIRIPIWAKIPPKLQEALVAAAQTRDLSACNRATYQLYGLSPAEVSVLGENP